MVVDERTVLQARSWELRRADPGDKTVAFYNNTVTDSYMLARWTWWDSSGRFWDTRLRVNKQGLVSRLRDLLDAGRLGLH